MRPPPSASDRERLAFHFVGGANLLKSALRLMSFHRLRIDEINADEVVTSYSRWVESVQVRAQTIRRYI
jgi:hypothetical protein